MMCALTNAVCIVNYILQERAIDHNYKKCCFYVQVGGRDLRYECGTEELTNTPDEEGGRGRMEERERARVHVYS